LVVYEDGGLVFWSFDFWVSFGIVFVVVGFLGVGGSWDLGERKPIGGGFRVGGGGGGGVSGRRRKRRRRWG
jgi:hypothetical protein